MPFILLRDTIYLTPGTVCAPFVVMYRGVVHYVHITDRTIVAVCAPVVVIYWDVLHCVHFTDMIIVVSGEKAWDNKPDLGSSDAKFKKKNISFYCRIY